MPGPRSTCRRSAGAASTRPAGSGHDAPHVVTGVSSHPRGVMPVSGTFRGDPDDYQGLKVMVQTEELAPVAAVPPPA